MKGSLDYKVSMRFLGIHMTKYDRIKTQTSQKNLLVFGRLSKRFVRKYVVWQVWTSCEWEILRRSLIPGNEVFA